MTTADLTDRFSHHPPTDQSVIDSHDAIRLAMRRAAEAVVKDVPVSREQSLALTKLEEAMFWSNAGIARLKNL